MTPRPAGSRKWVPGSAVLRALAIGMAVLVVIVLIVTVLATRSATNSDGQREAAVSELSKACAAGDQLSTELRRRGSCDVAAQAAEVPSATTQGRTDAEITALIAEYLAHHPELGRTRPDDVVEAARRVLATNPEAYRGTPGPAPTEASVASAAAAYITAHRAAFRGEPGEPGKPGEAGAPGPSGRGVASGPRPVRTDSGCQWVVTYTDGTSDSYAAGDSACPSGANAGSTNGGTQSNPPSSGSDTATQPDQSTGGQPAPTTVIVPPPPAELAPPPADGGLLGGLLGG